MLEEFTFTWIEFIIVIGVVYYAVSFSWRAGFREGFLVGHQVSQQNKIEFKEPDFVKDID